MPFEKFERKRSTTRSMTARCSLWRRGQINFNKAAVDEFDLGSKNRVALYYDADTNRIGFEFMETDAALPGTLSVKVRQSGVLLAGKSFLQHFGLLKEETLRYDLSYDSNTNLITIQLGDKSEEDDEEPEYEEEDDEEVDDDEEEYSVGRYTQNF